MKLNTLNRLTLYLVIIIVVACFHNVLGNGFVWDDDLNLVENLHYRGLSGSHLSWMFNTFHDANYHPLVWISFGLDYVLWGMNPAGYHLTNLIWHLINSVLFFYLIGTFFTIKQLFPDPPNYKTHSLCAAVGTLFFAIHPLKVESVAWVSTRADLMCAAFYMLTVMGYLKYVKSTDHKKKWYIGTLVFFVFSLLSRAWGITLPVVLLILDAYPLKRFNAETILNRPNARLFIEKIPLLIFSIPAGYLSFLAKSQRAVMPNLDQHGWLDRLMQSAYGLVFYLWKTIIPTGLSPLYLLDNHFNPFEIGYIVSFFLLMAIVSGVYTARKKAPGIIAALLCYAVIISPVLGFIQAGPQVAADRYTYVSCLPFGILISTGLLQLLHILNKKAHYTWTSAMLLSSILCLLTLFFFLSLKQSKIWQDENALWTQAIRVNPQNYIAYWNRGLFLDSQKNFEGALSDYSSAIKYNPTDDKYFNNRGAIRKMKGMMAGAMEDFNAAIKLNPMSPEPYANRATIYASQNNREQAIFDYQRALDVASQRWDQRKAVENLLNQAKNDIH